MGWLRKSRVILAGLASMALVSACSLLQSQVKEPELSVSDVRIVGMSLADAQIAVELDVKNPNAFGLSMQGLSYRLALQDKTLFNGSMSERLQVAANGNSRVTLPFTFRYEDVLGTVLALGKSQELRYQINGQADFGLVKLPYTKSGSFGLPKLPDISVQSVSINKFNLTGVELALELDVANGNNFPVRLDGMTYDLKLADSPLLKGKTTQPLAVNSNGNGRLVLNLALNYAQLGDLAQTLRSASSLPIEFNSRVQSPGVKDNVVIPYQWKGNVPLLR